MAYTIVKSDGTVLTTIADGTINTTSTSLGLPGRNYAGYGQSLDTNFVHMLENFADTAPPANPLAGQLWYNTNNATLYVCPTDGESNANAWLALTATSSGGNTSFGAVTVTGNLSANNIVATNNSNANSATFSYLTVITSANVGNANLSGSTNVANLRTTIITTGGNATAGNINGTYTVTGGLTGNSMILANGNMYITPGGSAPFKGLLCDNLMYSNGANIFGGGTAYSNSNVALYLPNYAGNVGNATTAASTAFLGTVLSTGANSVAGTITGNWTLSAGSRLTATYADLAERFEADTEYDPGTVVQLGGTAEITAVKYELSEDVFGVISNTAAYLMNGMAGDDKTHPPVAVSGRVQVKVIGKVKKGQRLVSAGQGKARAALEGEANAFNTIGRSLTDKYSEEEGFVEAIVMIR
jgi:hypothetical protein